MRDIGRNIKDLRIRRKMTQDELAERLFVTRQTVSHYETGKSRPDIDMLMNIAEVLHVDIHAVLYGFSEKGSRKDEHIRFAVAAGISLLLWILMAVLEDFTKELYFRYIIFPRILQYLLLLPTAFFFSGWTLMQTLTLFTGLRPLKGRYVPWVRRIILALLIGVLLFMLPYYADVICDAIRYLRFKTLGGTGEYINRGFFRMTTLHKLLWAVLTKHPAIFAFFGGVLWLFPAGGKKHKATPEASCPDKQ